MRPLSRLLVTTLSTRRRAAPLTFSEQMLALPGLVAYWPLNETSGTAADNAEGTAARDGAYVNTPTLNNLAFPAGGKIPLFDGVNECVNIYSASLASAFSGAKGWFMAWFLAPTPAATSGYLASFFADNDNRIKLYKKAADTYILEFVSGAKNAYKTITSTYTGLQFVAMDWDQVGDSFRFWWNGVRYATEYATTHPGEWVGALNSGYVTLAAWKSTGSLPFPGNLGHAAIGAGQVLSDTLVSNIFNAIIPATGQITFLGDSKTNGKSWCGRVVGGIGVDQSALWCENPERMAWDGYTVEQLHTAVGSVIASKTGSPSIACINIGVNDAASTLPAEAVWKANLTGVIDALRGKWPAIQIYIARVWDRRDPTDCATVNGWINAVIATQDYLHAGPDETVWLEGGDNGATMTSDGTHYSAAGLVECASQWLTALGFV